MNNRRPRVSIGLPVYNGERFLEKALDSLLFQSYTDFELIISDNASTDGTADICHLYAKRDRRVRYRRNPENIGAGRNFNRVFELSNGEYFKWATADDLCQPDHLARCLDVLDDDQTVVLAYPKVRYIDENGCPLNIDESGWDLRSQAAHERLRFALYACSWNNPHFGLIRARALAKTRLMPTYAGGDYRLLAELSLQGKFVEIPECFFLRRIHPGASSQNYTNFRWTMEFHGGSRGGTSLPFWHLSVDHLVTILRAGLNARFKLSLIGSLARSMWRQHDRLLRELKIGFMSCWGQLNHGTSRIKKAAKYQERPNE
jgi:glycosyltransferase involved in cell wall biosynthesis